MKRIAAVHYPIFATLLGLGALAVAIPAAVTLLQTVALGASTAEWTALTLFALAALPSAGIALSVRPATTLVLDLAYVLVASLLLPLHMAILTAFGAGCVAAFIPLLTGARVAGLPTRLGLSTGLMTGSTLAACGAVHLAGRFVRQDLSVETMILCTIIAFVGAGAVHLLLRCTGELMRGQLAVRHVAVYLRRDAPRDLLAIPISLLLILNLGGENRAGFLLVASLCLLGAIAVRRLDRTRLDLSEVNRDLEKRIEDLQSLSEIGREFSASLSVEHILDAAARECRRVFGGGHCSAALYDIETSLLRASAVRDWLGAARRNSALGSQAFAAWALSLRRPHLLSDTRRAGAQSSSLRGVVVPAAGRSAMAVPLRVEGKTAGVLLMQSQRSPYRPYDLSLLATVGQHTAIAIENARNYQRAIVDELTSLYQRDYFFRRLRDESLRSDRYGSPFGVLMLDLDGFKELNDRHGHVCGDRYLRALGEVIRASLRAADVPCRFGGEEFCLLLPETDLMGARVIAERVRDAVARLEVLDAGRRLHTTVSIGVAAHPEHGAGGVQDLVQRADEALYTAKRSGKNRVIAAAA